VKNLGNKKTGKVVISEEKEKEGINKTVIHDRKETVNILNEINSNDIKDSPPGEVINRNKKKIVFMVFECASWSSCGCDNLALILGLVNWLAKHDVMVLVPREYLQSKELQEHEDFKKLSAFAGDLNELASVVDLVVCLGGDGSMLSINKIFQTEVPPVMGFGIGRLNALFDRLWEEEESKHVILRFLRGELNMSILDRARLHVSISKSGEQPVSITALNEVTILRGLCPSMAMLDVMLDKEKLVRIEGDGVIVSTPTGSSAYSLSAGGPFLSPKLSCMVLTPLACLSTRSTVLPSVSSLVITISAESRADNLPVDVDGRVAGHITKHGRVEVTMSVNSFPQVMKKDIDSYWVKMIKSKIDK